MYRVFLERAAEKDLGRLSARLHDRVIAAIQGLSMNPRPTGCRKLTGTESTVDLLWAIGGIPLKLTKIISDKIAD